MNKAVQGQIKALVISLAKKQLMAWLVNKMAWTALPVINPLIGWIVGMVLEKVLEVTILGLYLVYIRIDVAGDVGAVNRVLEKIREKEHLTDEEIKQLDKDLAAAGRKLIRI